VPGNDIKQKIVLEGEKEYNKALSEARRNLKTLKSELKAETAELGRNATEQQKNETRIKSLQKQIKEQEKIVKTYKEALDQVREKYSDNEDAIAKWEQKLNYARESLANMKNELDGVGQSFKDVENSADMAAVASRSVAETFEKLSDIGGLISDGIESAFTGMISTVKSAVGEIWSEITDIAAKSDNYLDLASFLGASAEDVQKWDSALKATGGDLSVVTSLISRLKYGGKADKITEWFGVSDVNYENDLEYFQAVMEKMYELKGKMEDGTWDKAMSDIFGAKKVQDVDGVLSDWKDIVDGLDKFDPSKGGFGLTEEKISDMATLSVQVMTLKESWQKLKEIGTVQLFGKLSMDLTSNAQSILDGFLKYLNADNDADRDQALKQVEDNIVAMFEKAKEAILAGVKLLDQVAEDLKNSENPTAKALGNILSGLVDALQWLTEDNMKNVVSALEILAAFWVAGKGLEMGNKIASVAANLKTIQLSKILSNGGLGGTASAGLSATATVDAVSAAIAGSSGGLATAIVNALTSTTGVIGVGVMMLAPMVAKLFEQKTDEQKKQEEIVEEISKSQSLDDKIHTATVNGKTALHKLFGQDDGEEVQAPGKSFWDQYIDFLQSGQEKLDGIGNWLEEQHKIQEEASDYTYNDSWTIEEIMQDLERRRNEGQSEGGNSGNADGLSRQDAQSMTGAVNQMPAAVARALSGIRVYMNGQEVGNLVAPYVSAAIATRISG